jgi:hypothetical protein
MHPLLPDSDANAVKIFAGIAIAGLLHAYNARLPLPSSLEHGPRRLKRKSGRKFGKTVGECRIPRLTRIDLPHDSLRFGFDRCPISDRLLDPFLG